MIIRLKFILLEESIYASVFIYCVSNYRLDGEMQRVCRFDCELSLQELQFRDV